MRSSAYPTIVFDTPWHSDQMENYYESKNAKDLKKFLSRYDFTEQSRIYSYGFTMPEFRLGTKYYIDYDGYKFNSTIKWGPRFLVGRQIRMEGKRLFVNIPVDTVLSDADGVDVPRKWQWVNIHNKMYDAVIDLSKMRHLWPYCEESRSELNKFLTRISRERLCIRGY